MTKRGRMTGLGVVLTLVVLPAALWAGGPAGVHAPEVLWKAPSASPGELWVSHGWILSWSMDGTSVTAEPLGGGSQVVLDTSSLNSRLGVPSAAAVTPSGFVVSGLRLEDNGRKRFGALLFFHRSGKLTKKRLLKVAMLREVDALPDGRLVGWWEGLDRAPDGGYRGVSACSIFGPDLVPEKDLVPRRPLPRGNSLSRYDHQLLVHSDGQHIHVLDPFAGELDRFTLDGEVRERIPLPQLAELGERRVVRGWAPAGDAVWVVVGARGKAKAGWRLLKVVWRDGSVAMDRQLPAHVRLYPGPSGPLALEHGSELRALKVP